VNITMERIHIMRSRLFLAPRLALLALAGAATLSACSDDSNGGTGPSQDRMYNQIQRLGNPLISEVLLAKRSHPVHGSIGPKDDATTIGPEIVAFVTGVAGRDPAYVNALGGVLLPDMLIVQTDKDPATAGWLTWLPLAPFSNGWGGRKLADDVTDLALLAVFGDPFGLDPAGATGKEALTTDNVVSDSQFLTAFPYLGLPN
jgi:hypothetical protein